MTSPFPAIFQPLHDDVVAPARATEGAAGYDVRAYVRGQTVEGYRGLTQVTIEVEGDTLVIEPGTRVAVPLGFRAALPREMEAQLRLRSSIAFRRGLVMPNAPATIDSDFPGEWRVLVTNTLDEPVEIQHQERLAQIVFSRYGVVKWEVGEVGRSTDRAGGIGSTGR